MLGSTLKDIRDSNRIYKVIGIVKDFPFRSMHQPIEPLLLNPHLHFIDKIAYIKIPPGKFQEKIGEIEKKWKAAFPGAGFDHWFVNDEFNRMYKSERTVSALAKVFAVLAILITVLGVFSLASYTAEQRTKEIGIRKVLGASVTSVTKMLSKDFIKLVVIACLIAFPLSWWAMNQWLQSFAYRINISWWIFLAAGVIAILIALITVSFQAIRAAMANPVKSLRSE